MTIITIVFEYAPLLSSPPPPPLQAHVGGMQLHAGKTDVQNSYQPLQLPYPIFLFLPLFPLSTTFSADYLKGQKSLAARVTFKLHMIYTQTHTLAKLQSF